MYVVSTKSGIIRNAVGLLCGAICLTGCAALNSTNSSAETPLPFTTLPGEPSSRATRNSQRKADKAFEQGDFSRAHKVYLKDLAPKGDKHAHFMLGHLNEQGLGVPKDPARALAWYAVAAERGAEGAKAKGTQLLATLSASEQQRADIILAELMERYGDRPLLVKAIKLDQRELRMRTGSRVGGGTSPTLVISPDGRTIGGDQYYEALKARIAFRTQLLTGNVTLGEFELIDEREIDSEESEEP